MKCLLIGGNGFLGENIRQASAAEYSFHVANSHASFSNKEEWKNYLCDEVKSGNYECVILISAEQTQNDSVDDVENLIFVNCTIPASIASCLKSHSCQTMLITFGTSWQYADSNEYRPMNLYAATKEACKNILMNFSLDGIRIAQILLFDTYSATDSRRKLLPALESALAKREMIDVTRGEQEIDLIHIEDVVQGIFCTVNELKNYDPVNDGILIRGLGTKKPMLVKNLIYEMFKDNIFLVNFGARQYRKREVMKTYKSFITPKNWSIKNTIKF